MKRASFATVALIGLLAALVGCASPTTSNPAATATYALKSIDGPSAISVYPGKSVQLTVAFTPTNTSNKGLTYVASTAKGVTTATDQFTVSASGLVSAPITATLGKTGNVKITSTDGKKVINITVKIEKSAPAAAVAKPAAVAVAPTKSVAANGKSVPAKAAVGKVKKSAAKSVSGDLASTEAMFAAARNLGQPRSNAVATGTSVLYKDVYLVVADLFASMTDKAAQVAAVGILPVDAAFDITGTAADTGVDKTITVPTGAGATFSVADGSSLVLTGWQFHTLEELDGTGESATANPYYAQGYTQEINFTVGGYEYWLDFNDDSTLVLAEAYQASTGESFIVTADFNNAAQSFSYASATAAYTIDLEYDSASTVNGYWGNLAFGDATVNANVGGYFDDNGSFLYGLFASGSDAELTTDVAITVEQLDASGVLQYSRSGAYDDATEKLTLTGSDGTYEDSTQSAKIFPNDKIDQAAVSEAKAEAAAVM